jgi:hypothetical protein
MEEVGSIIGTDLLIKYYLKIILVQNNSLSPK